MIPVRLTCGGSGGKGRGSLVQQMDHIQPVNVCARGRAREMRCRTAKVVSGNRVVGRTGVWKTPTSGPVTLALPGQLIRRIRGKSSVPSAKFQGCADFYRQIPTHMRMDVHTRVRLSRSHTQERGRIAT